MWVSTFTHTAVSSSKRMIPALSTKTLSVQSTPSLINSKVAAATVDFSRLWIVTDPSAWASCPGRPARFTGSVGSSER